MRSSRPTATGINTLGQQRPTDMDEILDVVDLVADSGFEGIVTWLVRIVGLVALLGGLGLWLFTDMGLLVVPAVLLLVGLVLLIAPSVLLLAAELA
ncbi:hypothetical protein [Haloarcula sp. Atlit-7R]|nr:hypothetical protein [Haloarcula sp. Atlit-7R]